MINKFIKTSILLAVSGASLFSQTTKKYWIELDQDNFQISSSFQNDTLEVASVSEWLNAFTARLTEEQIEKISANELVLAVSEVKQLQYETTSGKGKYGDYVTSLDPAYLEQIGMDGTGVIAGVIDAGFINVDSGAAFEHIVSDNRILGYKDFIIDDREDFFGKETSGDIHGANVLAYFGGYDQKTQQRIGLGTGASFYLARTENGDIEHLVEEDDWIEAIEWMHSKGVRLVNTSLGYSEFDDSTESHTVQDMNGKTTKISIAAQKAVEKGMILVCSAGNLGHKEWKYVSAPADAEGVISVGATKKDDFSKEYYSSVGPEFNPYIKPDISTYSDRGTSYSSPEIAGLVACMLQKDPTLTPKRVKEALSISGHMNPLPNNFVGYGVPDPKILFDYLDGKEVKEKTVKRLQAKGDFIKIKSSEPLTQNIVVYHKVDATHVAAQLRVMLKGKDGEKLKKKYVKDFYKAKMKKKTANLKLFKVEGIKFSTVVINGELTEVEW